VNRIVVSGDHGTTWTVVKDFGSSSEGMKHTGLASHYATNWSGLYGGGNGWGGSSLRATIGRVVPANTTFYVDETNGVDWTNFGTSAARPIKTLDYLELLDVQPGDSVQFVGSNTYTRPLLVGWGGDATAKIALRGNPASTFVGGNGAYAPAVAETFEGGKVSWNFIIDESGGAVTADASVVHEGAQSAKVVRGDAGTVYLRLRNVVGTDIHEGDTMYLSYWVHYPADQTATSDSTMLRIVDTSDYELRLRLDEASASNLTNEMVLNVPVWSSWYVPACRSLTSGTWHKIAIEDYLHPTAGRFKLYVDDVLWYNVNGIQTVSAGGRLMDISFYNSERPITYYIDDLRFGKAPFDARGAVNTNGYDSLDIGGFGIRGRTASDIRPDHRRGPARLDLRRRDGRCHRQPGQRRPESLLQHHLRRGAVRALRHWQRHAAEQRRLCVRRQRCLCGWRGDPDREPQLVQGCGSKRGGNLQRRREHDLVGRRPGVCQCRRWRFSFGSLFAFDRRWRPGGWIRL
jgi:hypothetical protein